MARGNFVVAGVELGWVQVKEVVEAEDCLGAAAEGCCVGVAEGGWWQGGYLEEGRVPGLGRVLEAPVRVRGVPVQEGGV